jgi:hypothetical protein
MKSSKRPGGLWVLCTIRVSSHLLRKVWRTPGGWSSKRHSPIPPPNPTSAAIDGAVGSSAPIAAAMIF